MHTSLCQTPGSYLHVHSFHRSLYKCRVFWTETSRLHDVAFELEVLTGQLWTISPLCPFRLSTALHEHTYIRKTCSVGARHAVGANRVKSCFPGNSLLRSVLCSYHVQSALLLACIPVAEHSLLHLWNDCVTVHRCVRFEQTHTRLRVI